MMLENLLRLVAEGGVHSQDELMGVLSVSWALLEAMLDDLTKLGYLRSVEDGCGEGCTACPMGKCSVAGPGRLWSLTEKGAKAAAQLTAQCSAACASPAPWAKRDPTTRRRYGGTR